MTDTLTCALTWILVGIAIKLAGRMQMSILKSAAIGPVTSALWFYNWLNRSARHE